MLLEKQREMTTDVTESESSCDEELHAKRKALEEKLALEQKKEAKSIKKKNHLSILPPEALSGKMTNIDTKLLNIQEELDKAQDEFESLKERKNDLIKRENELITRFKSAIKIKKKPEVYLTVRSTDSSPISPPKMTESFSNYN